MKIYSFLIFILLSVSSFTKAKENYFCMKNSSEEEYLVVKNLENTGSPIEGEYQVFGTYTSASDCWEAILENQIDTPLQEKELEEVLVNDSCYEKVDSSGSYYYANEKRDGKTGKVFSLNVVDRFKFSKICSDYKELKEMAAFNDRDRFYSMKVPSKKIFDIMKFSDVHLKNIAELADSLDRYRHISSKTLRIMKKEDENYICLKNEVLLFLEGFNSFIGNEWSLEATYSCEKK